MATATLDLKGRGGKADTSFSWLALLSGVLVLVILVLIALVMTNEARPALSAMGLDFVVTDDWNVPTSTFGAAALIFGTLLSSAIAVVLAVPVSIGVALFITEVAPRRLRSPITWVVDLLAVIPSVVFGLWGLLVLAPNLGGFYGWLHDTLGAIPVVGELFGDPSPSGRAFLTAGMILAVMIVPIVTSLSREVISTTPAWDKEAALALGATKWEMIRGAVFPHAKGGLVGAVMLGLGRALGETIAAALVIGSAKQITANVLAPGDSMAAVIANEWGEASGLHRSALIALAVVLFAITILVNMAANAIVNRSMARSRGQ